jgi:hypothetical protein
MKTVLQILSLFSLMTVSIVANCTPYQQSSDDVLITFNNGEKAVAKKVAAIIDRDSSFDLVDIKYKAAVDRLKQQAAFIKEYAKANHFNTDYCFLVDMSLPSGKNRFFVYNIKKDSIEYSSLVAHGWGSYQPNTDQLVFSNTPNSFKTSLGKYKIGVSYNGAFGLAYKLYGLDTTNSNAYERAIVLHSEKHVPETETYPSRICESAGCPMVSPSFLAILGTYIRSSQKPVLMWIYN